jgi:hypothetical protein
MKKTLRVFRVTVLLFFFIGTVSSYWYSATHGYVSIYLSDGANGTTNGRLTAARGHFKDASKTSLAEFRSSESGAVYVIHPEAGDCHDFERKGIYSQADRDGWKRCNDALGRWIPSWIGKAKTLDLSFGKCELRDIPFAYRTSTDWWRWWVPLPHLGASFYTDYSFALYVNSDSCSVVQSG